jgi:hypothetical protein
MNKRQESEQLEKEFIPKSGNVRKAIEKIEQVEKQAKWEALQAFYRLKSLLLPDFIQRNKRSLNSIEAEIIRQYEGGENCHCGASELQNIHKKTDCKNPY